MERINIQEIKSTIASLKRRGEYDKYLTCEADTLSDKIVLMLMEVTELSDADIDAIVKNVEPVEEVSIEDIKAQVERAIRRAQGLDDDEGGAGVPARLGPYGRGSGGAIMELEREDGPDERFNPGT